MSEPSVVIAVSAAHRMAAIEAVHYGLQLPPLSSSFLPGQ